jgi:hypothetical protein
MTRKSAKNTGNFTFLEHFAAFPPHFAILNREKSVLEGRSVAACLPRLREVPDGSSSSGEMSFGS